MSRFYNVQLQHWQHWPKTLIVECHEYTPDNDGSVTVRRYKPERTCRDMTFSARVFKCSSCNASVDVIDSYGEPTMWVDGVANVPSYCPICGARIEE